MCSNFVLMVCWFDGNVESKQKGSEERKIRDDALEVTPQRRLLNHAISPNLAFRGAWKWTRSNFTPKRRHTGKFCYLIRVFRINILVQIMDRLVVNDTDSSHINLLRYWPKFWCLLTFGSDPIMIFENQGRKVRIGGRKSLASPTMTMF